MKKFLKSYAYLFGQIIIYTLIVSLINYFTKINMNLIKIIIPIISLLLSSIILGKNSNNKAYLEGIKFSIIYIIFIIIFSYLIIKIPFKIKNLLFYCILILTSMLGSMFGINLKNKH